MQESHSRRGDCWAGREVTLSNGDGTSMQRSGTARWEEQGEVLITGLSGNYLVVSNRHDWQSSNDIILLHVYFENLHMFYSMTFL